MTREAPKTLLDACRYYADPKVCFQTMLAVRWPDGKVTCPKCGGDNVGVITSRSLLQCRAKDCRKQFSVKVDTIFEDSLAPMSAWLVAVWCVATGDTISSPMLAEAVGVTQKTAWSMQNRIRIARQLSHRKRRVK